MEILRFFWYQVYSDKRAVLCCAQSLSHVWLFVTPWTVTHHAPLSVGILWTRILEWVAMPSSRRSSHPRDWAQVSCIAGGFFTIWASRGVLIREPLLHLGLLLCFGAWLGMGGGVGVVTGCLGRVPLGEARPEWESDGPIHSKLAASLMWCALPGRQTQPSHFPKPERCRDLMLQEALSCFLSTSLSLSLLHFPRFILPKHGP